MRVQIAIHPKTGELVLPKHYLRALSAAIWGKLNLPKEKEGSQPKLFCLSPLLFKIRETALKSEKIRLGGDRGFLLIASPLATITEAIAQLDGTVEIAGNLADIGKKEFVDAPAFQEEMLWQTLPGSGVCTKDNSEKGKGGKYIFPKASKMTCEQSLLRSLLYKWNYLCETEEAKAIRWTGEESPKEWAEKTPPNIEVVQSRTPFQETIKADALASAWAGQIKVTGHEAWQRLVWDCGLGTKTGLGFGMVEPSRK